MRYFLLTLLISSLSLEIMAQTACTQTLRRARTVYDEGRIQEMESLLEGCVESGFTDEERTEAYRLLILSYLYLDEPQKADEAMLALLKDNHEFRINERVDPAELISLYSTFRTRPIFRIGGKIGANTTFINTVNTATVNDLNSSNQGTYDFRLGFQAGVVFELPVINDNFTFVSEISFLRNAFEYTNDLFLNTDGSVVTNNILLENQDKGEFTAMLQYRITDWRIRPYVAIGGAINYMINSSVSSRREVLNEQEVRENTLELTDSRQPLTFYGLLSVGIKPKVKSGYFFSEFRFKYGLNNNSDNSEILKNSPEYIFDYYGPYNDFFNMSVELSFGYVLDIYKPKKLDQ